MTSPKEPLTDGNIDEFYLLLRNDVTWHNASLDRLCAQAREANALRTAPAPSEGKALEALKKLRAHLKSDLAFSCWMPDELEIERGNYDTHCGQCGACKLDDLVDELQAALAKLKGMP